ncbi:MFS transporter [Streptomyces sp. NPDC055078]
MVTLTSRSGYAPVLVLALLATPSSLSANTATTVIPEVAQSLSVSTADATWIGTAFGWGAVLGAPLTAALIGARGHRAAIASNAALVLLGTLLAALAPTLPVLLAGRAAQAAGGGGLATIALALAGTAARTGTVTAGVGLVGAFGPLAGSALSEATWRLPMCLSLPALLAIPSVLRHTRDLPAPGHKARTDGPGIALVTAVVSALVLLPRFPQYALIAAAVAGLLLAAHIRRRPDGFVPRPVLGSRTFRAAAVAACALSTSYFTLLYTVPRQLELHWSATHVGTATLIALAGGSTASLLFTRRAARLSPAITATVLGTAGTLAAALPLTLSWPVAHTASIAIAIFAATAAMAWCTVRATQAAPAPHRGATLALTALSYQLGGAFGPALATLLVT